MNVKRLTLGRLQTNCYVLVDEDTKECAIFDPADECEKILACVTGYNVKYIILTHIHIDHVMALDKLKEITSATVVVHTEDAKGLNSPTFTLADVFGVPAPSSKVDMEVKDGDTLFLGKNELKIIHTPGHTLGSMCILCGDILISGDTLFLQSVGRSDLPGGSHSELILSVRDKLFLLDDNTRVYAGHGDSTTIVYEKKNNPYIY